MTREAVTQMLGFELAHVGINAESADVASEVANAFHGLFNTGLKDGNSSIFAGKGIEVMKAPYLGAKGHIAYRTNYIERASQHRGDRMRLLKKLQKKQGLM